MKRKTVLFKKIFGYLLLVAISGFFSCKSIPSNKVGADIPKLYKVGHAEVTITAEHAEAIDLVVSYPINSKDNFPLLVFSHGNGLDANAYHNLTNKWVELGYVVVAPNHLDSGSTEKAGLAQKKYGSDWVSASRVLDLSATINQIETIIPQLSDFKGGVNTEKIIAAGHSFGALTAQMLAGATLEKQGNSERKIPFSLKDNRVVAVVAISPPGLIPNFLSQNTWTTFDTPQLVVTGTNDISPPFWPTYDVHLVSYESAVAGNNYLLVLDGADHYLGNLIGNLNREEAPQELALKNLIDQSIVFINHHLRFSTGNKLNNLKDVQVRKGVVRYEHR